MSQETSNIAKPPNADDVWNLPNRPPPQKIANTPFVLYPAPNNGSNNGNNNNNKHNNNETNDEKEEKKEKTQSNNNNNNNNNDKNDKNDKKKKNKNNKGIISVEFNNNNSNNNKNKDRMPRLTNDLNYVISEIETIHNRVFHLRRTNKEIKQFYSDDIDCQTAYNENIDIINKNVKNLIVYFDLYKDLTNGQIHKYDKLYQSDRKMIEKFDNIEKKSVEYMMPAPKNNQQSKNDNSRNNTNKSNNDAKQNQDDNDGNDNGISIDEDGGITI